MNRSTANPPAVSCRLLPRLAVTNITAPLQASPGAPNFFADALPAYDSLWLNELQPGNVTGITDNNGQRCGYLFLDLAEASQIPAIAEPWFQAFNAAIEIHPVMVPEDLAKAATAARIDAYGTALSATALGALPGDITPLEKAVAGADVISILRIGTPIETASLCSETAIQQPLRKKQCSAIARVLAAQGSTLIELSQASYLADRLAFPQDMRTALKTESKNARAALTRSYPWGDSGGGATFGCDTVLGYDSFIDALQAAGGNERAAARALVAAGRPADGH